MGIGLFFDWSCVLTYVFTDRSPTPPLPFINHLRKGFSLPRVTRRSFFPVFFNLFSVFSLIKEAEFPPSLLVFVGLVPWHERLIFSDRPQ